MDWRHLVYTDGSAPAVQQTNTGAVNQGQTARRRMGSGVYRPASRMQDDSQEELCVRLDPAGYGITNTINRAELAPIEYALRQGVGTHIASDSACSLYQIAKMIHQPMYMQQHKHAPLLRTITDHIRAAPSTIYLYKVPAHSGLVGNERADQLAKEAAVEGCVQCHC